MVLKLGAHFSLGFQGVKEVTRPQAGVPNAFETLT